jgi:hypothetical protein
MNIQPAMDSTKPRTFRHAPFYGRIGIARRHYAPFSAWLSLLTFEGCAISGEDSRV